MSSLGDVVLASSVPLAVKEAIPEARITFLTRNVFADVFKHNPAVNEVLSYPPRGVDSVSGIFATAAEVRSRKFDVVLDLQSTPRTALVCRLAPSGDRKTGDRDAVARHAMVRFKRYRPRRVRHSVQRFLRAAERACGPVPASRPRMFLADEEKNLAEEFLALLPGQGRRPLVGLCPGAKWKTKIWSAERFGLLAQELRERDLDVCVVGGEVDAAVLQDVEKSCERLEGVRFHVGGLRSSAALLARCDCVVSNDSGLMHVAHAVGTPVVALFGSTVPEFGFYPPDSCSSVISNSFDCKPCDVHGKDSCNEGDMRCMESIDVALVAEEVQRILSEPRAADLASHRRLQLPRFVLGGERGGASPRAWSAPHPGSLAVRAPNWVGDAVMACPSLEALKECMRGGELVVVAHERVVGILEQSKVAGKLVRLRRGGVAGVISGAVTLRRNHCEAGVAMPDSFSSAVMLRLGGVKKIVGFGGELRDRMLAVCLERQRWSHLCEQYAQLVPAGCIVPRGPRLFFSAGELGRARQLLRDAGVGESASVVLLAPGATYGETKRWPAENFARLAGMLCSGGGFQAVLVGSRVERELCREIAERSDAPVVDLSGKTGLRELAAVASRGAVFVGNDSGAVHVAAASGCPVVVVFGSSDPYWTAPRGKAVRVLYDKLSCSPCFRKTCPYELECLGRIGVEDVYRAAMELSRSGDSEGSLKKTEGGDD
ncbi:MAG: lipopolysaccharide heptosyltransferase II [Candidatus Eiseniibacteriota bacterium]|nr:MAG: lipopolysaccharide heptosyltransferase II [Candidatus Eisenbacteria bacterium]